MVIKPKNRFHFTKDLFNLLKHEFVFRVGPLIVIIKSLFGSHHERALRTLVSENIGEVLGFNVLSEVVPSILSLLANPTEH